MDKKTNKLVIAASKPAEEGILAIINYLKEKEIANGKKEKAILSNYLFENSYAVATLIKHYYDNVTFAVFDVVNTTTNAKMEHACVVLAKKNETVYFDINGKKSLDEMKKFVARQAKASVKNVEVKEGYFYAITSVTNALFNEIERNVPAKANAKKVVAKAPTKNVASKATAKSNTKVAKQPAKKPVATKKTVAKTATKTNTTKKVAAKTVAKKPATTKTVKPVAKKTTAKKVVSKNKKK